MLHGLPQPYQTACLVHALSCMSGVTQLSLRWDRQWWESESVGRLLQFHPAPQSVSQLTAVLPKLDSLHIACIPLFRAMVESLMKSSQLQHLRLDDTPVYGLGCDEIALDGEVEMSFSYPRRWPNVLQLIEQRADEQQAKRRNRRLRLALCKYWEKEVQECLKYFVYEDHLVEMAERCAEVKKQLLARWTRQQGTARWTVAMTKERAVTATTITERAEQMTRSPVGMTILTMEDGA